MDDKEEKVDEQELERKDSWYDDVELFRVKLKKFITTNIFGIIYVELLMYLSILSTFLYIYSTYHDPLSDTGSEKLQQVKDVERFLTILFLFDYFLNLFLSEHKVAFISSFSSNVDLITIFPIWIQYLVKPVSFDQINTAGDFFVYFCYGLSTCRILRTIRIYRKLKLIEDEVQRVLGEMILTILIMLLFDTAVIQYLDIHRAEHANFRFHTWMYAVWVTLATVGFGDITPKSTLGKFFIMAMISLAIIQIPRMTNDLLAKMALTSIYERAFYVPKHSAKHVLVVGNLSTTSIREFFVEFFHDDHDAGNTNAIILQSDTPSFSVSAVLSDPRFLVNVIYLQGSALEEKDLKRCCADSAVAIFFLTNKFAPNSDEEDSKIILQYFNISRYCRYSNPFFKCFFCLQLIRPENQRHLDMQSSGASVFGDADNDDNVIVCLNEIKMGIIAKSIMFPGVNSLLLNLLTTIDDDDDEDGDDDEDDDDDVGNWLDEYKRGCDWEIYSTELGSIFEGRNFTELSTALYSSKGIVLFGLQVRDLTGKYPTRILLNPKDYVIPQQSDMEVTGYVIAKNKAASDLSMKDEEKGENQLALESLQFSNIGLFNQRVAPAPDRRESVLHESYLKKNEEAPVKELQTWQKLLRNYDAERNQTETQQELQQRVEDEYMKMNFFVREKPASLAEVTIHTSVAEEIPNLQEHVIILGKGISNLYDLIRPLRARSLGSAKCIVILFPGDIPYQVWQRISIFQGIFVIRGSALEENDLIRAGIFRSLQVIVLADTSSISEEIEGQSSSNALHDADAIFSYQAVKRLNERANCVVEIVKQANIGYLDPEAVASGEGYYRFTPQFGAGTLFTTSMLDYLACQAFYNPQIIKLVNAFISNADVILKSELMNTFEGNKRVLKGLSAVVSSTLHQISIPDGLESRTYGALFRFLGKSGVIPIGLYRGVFSQMKSGPKNNKLPYVFTNPPKDTELFSCDKVFVLSPHPASVMQKHSKEAPSGGTDLQSAEDALIQNSLAGRSSVEATTASLRDQFAYFGAEQGIMKRHLEDITAEVKSKMMSVSESINSLKLKIQGKSVGNSSDATSFKAKTAPSTPYSLVGKTPKSAKPRGIRPFSENPEVVDE